MDTGNDDNLEPMLKTIKAVDFKATYAHPKISIVTYLFMREIIF